MVRPLFISSPIYFPYLLPAAVTHPRAHHDRLPGHYAGVTQPPSSDIYSRLKKATANIWSQPDAAGGFFVLNLLSPNNRKVKLQIKLVWNVKIGCVIVMLNIQLPYNVICRFHAQ